MRKAPSIAVLALALAASGPAWAQARAEFTDQQLESFVVAARAVDGLIREWNPRIEGAENAEERPSSASRRMRRSWIRSTGPKG
jgi:hypothetical protein